MQSKALIRTGARSQSYLVSTSTFRALPEDRYPLVKAMAPFLTAGDGLVRFEFGLSVLVAGLDSLKQWTPDRHDST